MVGRRLAGQAIAFFGEFPEMFRFAHVGKSGRAKPSSRRNFGMREGTKFPLAARFRQIPTGRARPAAATPPAANNKVLKEQDDSWRRRRDSNP